MHLGRLLNTLLISGWLVGVSGCTKTKPTAPVMPTPLAPDTVLRVHWVGKQTLGVAAGAYTFMRLWNLPESKRVETQLLEKLCAAPWRRATNQPAANNASPALQPLLEDVLNEECSLEIRAVNGQVEQLVFAIRLNPARATLWQVNLAAVLAATEDAYPAKRPGGWSLKSPRSKIVYELGRAGEWIVCGRAAGTNALFQEIMTRSEREQVPFTVTTARHWLTVDADLRWVARELFVLSDATADAPRLSLMLAGDGANAVTSGEFVFAQPLTLELTPWAFPQSQVQEPVIGFAAVRGLGPWLTATKTWSDLKLGRAPNQIFTWADARTPLQMQIAAPSETAQASAKALGETLLTRGNEWLAEHGLGRLGQRPGGNGVSWKDLPLIAPHLSATDEGWLGGGLISNPEPGSNAPADIYPRPSLEALRADITSRTNLVAYEWETTGARAESFHFLAQILRVATRHPQLPADTASSQWLQSVRQRLGNTTTLVTLVGPNRLAFERTSTTGFSAAELHLIADWLESPEFPRGLYGTLSPLGPAPTAPTSGAQ